KPGVPNSPMTARTPVIDAIPVSREQVSAFRLSRHHLIDQAPASGLVQVAGDMGGAQAQLLSAAQISLWARTRGLRLANIEAPWVRDPPPVKAGRLRAKRHLLRT